MNSKIKQTTLCYLKRGSEYLMLHRTKKQNDQSHDKWLAVGGKFEAGESPEDCVSREVFEETGLRADHFRYAGIVTFVSDIYEQEMMHLFVCDSFSGEIKSCDEGELEWIPESKLKELPMWEGDAIFLDLLLKKSDFFSLKLKYAGESLEEAVLNGRKLLL